MGEIKCGILQLKDEDHMYSVEENIGCPYCGEVITILVDPSIPLQAYIEDCQVCCQPIEITVNTNFDGVLSVTAKHQDDC